MAKRLEGWKGRMSPARLVVLVIALALVAILGYRQIDRLTASRTTVFTAAADLAVGNVVDAAAIAPLKVAKESVTGDIVRDRNALEGRTLTRPKTKGAPFRARDFASPPAQPGLAESLPEGRVMLTVTPSNLRPLVEIAQLLRLGDRFEILALTPGGSTVVARDVYFLAWMEPRAPETGESNEDGEGFSLFGNALEDLQSQQTSGAAPAAQTPLLVGLRPQDVVPLSTAQAQGAYLMFVLHGRKEVEAGRLLPIGVLESKPVEIPREVSVELLAGGRRDIFRVRR